MSNRSVAIRLGIDGKADVSRDINDITRSGVDGFNQMATAAGNAGDRVAAQYQKTAAAAKQAALSDEVNRSWNNFLGVHDHVTNSARDSAAAFEVETKSVSNLSGAVDVGTRLLGAFGIALSVERVVEWGKEVLRSTAEIENQSKVLGLSTDGLQAYHAAAVLSGAGADVGDAAIRRFTRSIGDAEAGSKKQADAFAQLHITAGDLADGTESALPKAAAALLAISDASERAKLEVELFGKAGQEVEAVLQKWADPDIIQHMKDMGLVIDEELVKRAHAADVAFETMWLHIKVGAAESGGAIASFFEKTAAEAQRRADAERNSQMGGNATPGTRLGVQNFLALPQNMPIASPDTASVLASSAATDKVFKDIIGQGMRTAATQLSELPDTYKDAIDGIRKVEEEEKKAQDEQRAALKQFHNDEDEAYGRYYAGLEKQSADYWKEVDKLRDKSFEDTERAVGEADALINRLAHEYDVESDRIKAKAQDYQDYLGQLGQELSFAYLTNEQRKIESDLIRAANKAKQDGVVFDKDAVRAQLELIQDAQKWQGVVTSMEGTFSSFLKTAETTGKFSFGSLFRGILSDWEDMLNKMWSEKLFQSIFGGGASAGAGGAAGGLGGLFGGGALGFLGDLLHDGGIAGDPNSPKRAVPAAWLHGARRFHTGGLAGDEVPAILQKGERVLSRSQTADYNSGMSQPGGISIVNNIDARGATADTVKLIESAVNRATDAALAKRLPGILETAVKSSVSAVSKRVRYSGGRLG